MDSRGAHVFPALYAHIVIAYLVALYEELQRSIHSYPPAERLYPFDMLSLMLFDDFVIVRSDQFHPNRHFVTRHCTREHEFTRVSLQEFVASAVLSCSESRITVLERDEFLIEVGIFVSLPRRNRVLLKKEKSVIPTHLLTGINQRLSARKSKCKH